MTLDDPRLSYTYSEFPLDSFEYILQKANDHLSNGRKSLEHLIDLGSGCGRLCFYAALTLDGCTVHY